MTLTVYCPSKPYQTNPTPGWTAEQQAAANRLDANYARFAEINAELAGIATQFEKDYNEISKGTSAIGYPNNNSGPFFTA